MKKFYVLAVVCALTFPLIMSPGYGQIRKKKRYLNTSSCCTSTVISKGISYAIKPDKMILSCTLECNGLESSCTSRFVYIVWRQLLNGTWESLDVFCKSGPQFCGDTETYNFYINSFSTTYGSGNYRITFGAYDNCGGYSCDNPTGGGTIFFTYQYFTFR